MTMFSINNNDIQSTESTNEINDTNISTLSSTIDYISGAFNNLIENFTHLFNFSQDSGETVTEGSLNKEVEAYKRELSPKVEDLKKSLELPNEIDLLNNSSIKLLEKLGQAVGWVRAGLQWCAGSAANTPFQNLIFLIKAFKNEQNKISSEIENIKNKSSSIKNSLEAISTSIKSLNEKCKSFESNVLEWRKQKTITSDIDKLKLITLTNVIIDMITDIGLKKIELNGLKAANLFNKADKIRRQKSSK